MTGKAKLSAIEQMKDDLRRLKPEEFVMHRIFDAVPILFRSPAIWTDWKLRLASRLKVDAHSVVVIGSGCVGFSLNPHKNYRRFQRDSDVDVAVVSSYHFEVAWRFLRDVGAGLYSYSPEVQASIKNHRDEYLFWGTIATEKLLPYFEPFGPGWVRALSDLGNEPPLDGREIKIRLYRDSYSLVGYHVSGIRRLQQELLSTL